MVKSNLLSLNYSRRLHARGAGCGATSWKSLLIGVQAVECNEGENCYLRQADNLLIARILPFLHARQIFRLGFCI